MLGGDHDGAGTHHAPGGTTKIPSAEGGPMGGVIAL